MEARVFGTKVIASKVLIRRKNRLVYDMAIPFDRAKFGGKDVDDSFRLWEPGQYVGANSGVMCVQIAVNFGATQIAMIGMEGYKSNQNRREVDYFDGTKGLSHHRGNTLEWHQPVLQSIIDRSPHIDFFMYGSLNYELTGDNLLLIS